MTENGIKKGEGRGVSVGNENLVERLRQIAESRGMDFDSPDVAATLNEAADALEALSMPGERPLNIERENAAAEHVRTWLRSGSCGDRIGDQIHDAFVTGAEWERDQQ